MSGLRRCAECDSLFRLDNAGPEAMRGDVTFHRHECTRCGYLKTVLEGLSGLPRSRTEFTRTGAGPVAHVIVPHAGAEAHVLSVRWLDKEKVTADVCEDSGKILAPAVTFSPGGEDALGPLLALL